MIYSGRTCAVKIGGKLIAHLGSFSLSTSTDIAEIISFGNEWKEKLPTIKDWSGTADGTVDFEKDSGQKDLWDALMDGTEVELQFELNATTFFAGTAFIESLEIDTSADGVAEISASFAGSNANVLTVPVTP